MAVQTGLDGQITHTFEDDPELRQNIWNSIKAFIPSEKVPAIELLVINYSHPDALKKLMEVFGNDYEGMANYVLEREKTGIDANRLAEFQSQNITTTEAEA